MSGPDRHVGEDELAELLREGRGELEVLPAHRAAAILAAISDEVDADEGGGDAADLGAEGSQAGSVAAHPAGRRATPDQRGHVAEVVRPSRWRTTAPWVAAAASFAAALAIVLPGDGGADPVPLAEIRLDALADDTDAVTATVLRDGAERVVEVDLAAVAPGDGFLEVWLLDVDAGSLVSLGPARPDGRYVVPDGVDLVALPTVDVSREPLDGDPGHSGDSVLRGTLSW